jgi:hypothetical protein
VPPLSASNCRPSANLTRIANAAGATNASPTPSSTPPAGSRAIASYFDALRDDPELASSILNLVQTGGEVPLPRQPNIVLIGLMGSGKTTVGRIVAQMIGFQFVDTDAPHRRSRRQKHPRDLRQRRRGRIPPARVRRAALAARQTRLRHRHRRRHHHPAAQSAPPASPRLHRLAGCRSRAPRPPHRDEQQPPAARRRGRSQGQARTPPHERKPLYKSLADLRIQTAELTPQETAYGVMESARVFFAKMKR